jgi:hypothetical protein
MEDPERFKVPDDQRKQWGKLVKAWAKGEKEVPKDLTELRAQCTQFSVQPHIPDFITGVVFVQNDKHILTVRLPPKDLLVAGEEFVKQSEGAYPLPTFYTDFFSQATPKEDLTPSERVTLHSARVGEYSVNSCA